MKIYFKFLSPATISDRTRLKSFIERSIKRSSFKLDSLAIIICSDHYLLNINKLYLNHDYLTDIISFDLSESDSVINGELYISIDRVRNNAADFSVSIREELHRVIFHGALHLLGFKDNNPSQKKQMRMHEDKWLRSYGFHV